MAAYRQHLSVSGVLGAAYAIISFLGFGCTGDEAAVAGVLTWIGGMLPDLDSQTGRPVRELFGLISVLLPVSAIPHLVAAGIPQERILLFVTTGYLTVRYGGAALLAKLSVHRGMFHSIPAMLIATEFILLAYPSERPGIRLLMAGGISIGFLSHLLLDEMYSVQWDGMKVRLTKSAGSALKLASRRFVPNTFAWTLAVFLGYANLVQTGMIGTQPSAGPVPKPESISPDQAREELDHVQPSVPGSDRPVESIIGEEAVEMFR